MPDIALDASVFHADADHWHDEEGYRREAVPLLELAHAYNKHAAGGEVGDGDSYEQALDCAQACLQLHPSRRQEMVARYAEGVAQTGLEEYAAACETLDEAAEIAGALADIPSVIVVTYLLGSLHDRIMRFTAACRYLKIGDDLLQLLNGDGHLADPSLEQLIMFRLANCEFLREHYKAAWRYLGRANTLRLSLPSSPENAASDHWLRAILYRWSGAPETALKHAVTAVEIQARLPGMRAAIAFTRLAPVAAETALDVADTYPDGTLSDARAHLATIGGTYADQALATARAVASPIGEALATLARVRYLAQSGELLNPLPIVEPILHAAERAGDVSLVSQAYTAMGRAFAASGEHGSAMTCYRDALAAIERYDMSAIGTWARREIARDREGLP